MNVSTNHVCFCRSVIFLVNISIAVNFSWQNKSMRHFFMCDILMCENALDVLTGIRKKSPRKFSLNAVQHKPVPTRVLNLNASKSSYKLKQRIKKKLCIFFFGGIFSGAILSGGFYSGTVFIIFHICYKIIRSSCNWYRRNFTIYIRIRNIITVQLSLCPPSKARVTNIKITNY